MSKPNHASTHGHTPAHPGQRPSGLHRDWRTWAVVLMLAAMAIYVLTFNESIWPGGNDQPVPEIAE